ncbi:MAG: hypothetical protein ABI861_09010, partial [Panacibacter sp.]
MEKKRKKKILIKLLVCATVIIAVFLIGNVILKNIVEQKFNAALEQFSPVIQAKYSDIHINLLSASADIDSFSIQYHPDLRQRQHKHAVYFSAVHIRGINYFKLISGKNFSASALQLNNADIKLDSYLFGKKDTVAANILSAAGLPFENISFGKMELSNAGVKEINGRYETSLFNGNLTINDIN